MKKYVLLFILFSVALLVFTSKTHAQPLPEDTLKAGYLYYFGQLTKWPESALNGQLHYCVYGGQAESGGLSSLLGKKIAGRDIAIKTVKTGEDIDKCNLLYLRSDDPYVGKALVDAVSSKPVLTITDDERLADLGVAIHIKPQGERLVFSIDNSLALAANLQISSKLLKLAK